ncbi:MAG: DUF6427 family protein [Aureibaculum sp.]
MIAKFFKKTKPINTLIVLVLLTIVFIITTVSFTSTDFTLTNLTKKLILFAFLVATLFIINFIVRKNGLTKNNSYVILLVVFCFAIFPFSTLNSQLLGTHFLLLLAYRRIYSLRTTKDIKDKIFDASFWIGIATLIYPWSFLYLTLVFFAVFYFNKLTLKNTIIPLVGFITPIFIYGVYLLLIDDFDTFDLKLVSSLSILSYNSFKLLIPIALISGFLIWAIFPTTIKIIAVNNEFRASWFLLLMHLLISVFVIIPSPIKNGSEFLFLFFPMAIIFTNYLQIIEEKWFKEVFLYFFLAATITIYLL